MGLENGEYILKLKENKIIWSIDGLHKKPFISYYPKKEYKLIVKTDYCILFDEEYKKGIDVLYIGGIDLFYIKKVA